jgi:hypothetical protein
MISGSEPVTPDRPIWWLRFLLLRPPPVQIAINGGPVQIVTPRTRLPILVWVLVVAAAAFPAGFIVHGLTSPMPETGTFGNMIARYYTVPSHYWGFAAITFAFAFAITGIAVYVRGGFIVFLVLLALVTTAVGEGSVWQLIERDPSIVISKSGIDCYHDSAHWYSIRWSDVIDLQRGVDLVQPAHGVGFIDTVEFRLKPAAAATFAGRQPSCWISNGLPEPSGTLYGQIHAAWERGR